MALTSQTVQFIDQIPTIREIDVSQGPSGPGSVVAHWLVPASGWLNSQRFPYEVVEDLKAQKFETTEVEGVVYYKVPEVSTNLPGRLAHYAERTGVADLENAPGGGVNRVRETLENTADATVAPDAIKKFVDDNDSFEEARKKASKEEEIVNQAVSISPAREPANADLVDHSDAPQKTVSEDAKIVGKKPKP